MLAGPQGADLWQVFLNLPIITQMAVTLLLVTGIIVHVFAYNVSGVPDPPFGLPLVL